MGNRQRIGETNTGVIFEQTMKLCFQGEELFVRRVTVELYEPTREKETVLHLLCNLAPSDADGCMIADALLAPMEIENAFQTLTMTLNCEHKSNCYRVARYCYFVWRCLPTTLAKCCLPVYTLNTPRTM